MNADADFDDTAPLPDPDRAFSGFMAGGGRRSQRP